MLSLQFDEVWYTDHCEQRCECEEDDDEGHIECDDDECDGDDICYMDGEGEYTCKSTGIQLPVHFHIDQVLIACLTCNWVWQRYKSPISVSESPATYLFKSST